MRGLVHGIVVAVAVAGAFPAPAISLPATLTPTEMRDRMSGQGGGLAWQALFIDQAPAFDPIVSAVVGHRTIGIAFFGEANGHAVGAPYVYCPGHTFYEALPLVAGATAARPGLVGGGIDAAYMARVTGNVHRTVLETIHDAPGKMIRSLFGLGDTAPEPPPTRASSEDAPSHGFGGLLWGALLALVVGSVVIGTIAEYVSDRMATPRREEYVPTTTLVTHQGRPMAWVTPSEQRPIVIEYPDVVQALQEGEDRLSRSLSHLQDLEAAVEDADRRLFNTITNRKEYLS